MGEAKRRREAAGRGGTDPALASLSAMLAADAKADFDHFRRSQVPGRKLFTVEIMSVEQAAARPVVGPTVVRAVAACLCSAFGAGDLICECWLCAVRFGPGRPPASAMVMEQSRPRFASVGLVCEPCAAKGEAEMRRLMQEAVRRDFLGGGEVEVVPASAFGPGGSA